MSYKLLGIANVAGPSIALRGKSLEHNSIFFLPPLLTYFLFVQIRNPYDIPISLMGTENFFVLLFFNDLGNN